MGSLTRAAYEKLNKTLGLTACFIISVQCTADAGKLYVISSKILTGKMQL